MERLRHTPRSIIVDLRLWGAPVASDFEKLSGNFSVLLIPRAGFEVPIQGPEGGQGGLNVENV